MLFECIAGATCTFRIAVYDDADTTIAKTNPTIDAANDFLISINGGAWDTLDNAPVVSPAGSEVIMIVLSATETTAAGANGSIVLRAADASDSDGWIGGLIEIPVRGAAVSTLTTSSAIGSVTGDVGGNVVGSLGSLSVTAIAQVNAEADQALADYDAPTKAELDTAIGSLATSLAAINTKLGSPAGATVSADLASLQAVVDAINAQLVTTGITVLSTINGDEIEVYRNDTWKFTATVTGLTLTDYEAIALVVKKTTTQADADALLYVRSDDGLLYLGGAAATAGDGTLTIDSATQFSVNIKITATDVTPGAYIWALKCFDTTPATDEGFTRAKGKFAISDYWLRATA